MQKFSIIPWQTNRFIWVFIVHKVNSGQEACAKCFTVYILRFEILQITWNKEHQTLSFQCSIDWAFWCFLFCFFMWFARFQILHNMWTSKHLSQASCFELTEQLGPVPNALICSAGPPIHICRLLYSNVSLVVAF